MAPVNDVRLVPARSGLALIQSEYDDLASFGVGKALESDAAAAIATVCLTRAASSDERIQQLRLAGALVALEIERLLAIGATRDDQVERLRAAVDL